MVVNPEAIKQYLSGREEQGAFEEIDAAYFDRIVYTHNGVAKIREISEDEDGSRIVSIAENNWNALRQMGIDRIPTTHAYFKDYLGEEVLVAFQPYTEEPDEVGPGCQIWAEALEKGLRLDLKPENFGVQFSSNGEEIRYGLRDVSDQDSVTTKDPELARELGVVFESLESGYPEIFQPVEYH